MGYDPLLVSTGQFTTASVINELKRDSTAAVRLKLAVETEKIQTYVPSEGSLEEVNQATRRSGDFSSLSKADKDILATAFELAKKGVSIKLISDDYAIQNVARFLGLMYVSLTTLGIHYQFKWKTYCPACKRTYKPEFSQEMVCSVCGTRLKRKVIKKQTMKGS